MRVEETGYSMKQRPYFECVTIEGNTDLAIRRDGGLTLRHYRRLTSEKKDQFIRWTSLDGREERAAMLERIAEAHARARPA